MGLLIVAVSLKRFDPEPVFSTGNSAFNGSAFATASVVSTFVYMRFIAAGVKLRRLRRSTLLAARAIRHESGDRSPKWRQSEY